MCGVDPDAPRVVALRALPIESVECIGHFTFFNNLHCRGTDGLELGRHARWSTLAITSGISGTSGAAQAVWCCPMHARCTFAEPHESGGLSPAPAAGALQRMSMKSNFILEGEEYGVCHSSCSGMRPAGPSADRTLSLRIFCKLRRSAVHGYVRYSARICGSMLTGWGRTLRQATRYEGGAQFSSPAADTLPSIVRQEHNNSDETKALKPTAILGTVNIA